ncbi:LysM peptidoglycan-binding domain-containing protein [Bacillus glycinifermentans]|uniref:LysM peptidoglycan-binding domain-containing protein n=2 Tax=Bacillus glycinifermentans TaxID=1664069 RepID=A0ABU6H8Z6_9BACI|nr:LysM peptidoglycan-binding domain-containing protein [Bacillus glycinifermentans]MEC0487460.1 LysM peptidoglycan-binding domain-containing protein [Bacillus glycinifermentans]
MPQNHRLQFSVEESICFQKGQEVSELLSISLDPDISVQEVNDYVSIRGSLELTGEYNIDQTWEYAELPATSRFVEDVKLKGDGSAELTHCFPVDITIPKNKVNHLNDVFVFIDAFDYQLTDARMLTIQADLAIEGLLNVSGEEEEKNEARTPPVLGEIPQYEEEPEPAYRSYPDEEDNAEEKTFSISLDAPYDDQEVEEETYEDEDETDEQTVPIYQSFLGESGNEAKPFFAASLSAAERTKRDLETQKETEEMREEVKTELKMEESSRDAEAEPRMEESSGNAKAEPRMEESSGNAKAEPRMEASSGEAKAELKKEASSGNLIAEPRMEKSSRDAEAEPRMEKSSRDAEAEPRMEASSREAKAELKKEASSGNAKAEPKKEASSGNLKAEPRMEASSREAKAELKKEASSGDAKAEPKMEESEAAEETAEPLYRSYSDPKETKETPFFGVPPILQDEDEQEERESFEIEVKQETAEEEPEPSHSIEIPEYSFHEQEEPEEERDDNAEEETKENDNALYLTKLFTKQGEEEFARMRMCIVQQNDTIDLLCERYGINAQQLIRMNSLSLDEELKEGQILYIPDYQNSHA